MKHIIFDTDLIGDDLLTIINISKTSGVELSGITSYGRRIGSIRRCRIAQELLEKLEVKNVEILMGASRPLMQEALPGCTFCDEVVFRLEKDWSEHKTYSNTILDMHAANYLIQKTKNEKGKYSLLCTGPLTNLALAISLEPEIVTWFKEIVVMGGTWKVCGNSNAVAEANIYNDPDAAKIVFERCSGIKVIGLDVTLQVVIREKQMEKAQKTFMNTFLFDLVASCCTAHKVKGGDSIMPLHDVLAFFVLMEPSLVTCIPCEIKIETCSKIANGRMIIMPTDNNGPHLFATEVDVDAVISRFFKCMEGVK